jgi:hypothetical protein
MALKDFLPELVSPEQNGQARQATFVGIQAAESVREMFPKIWIHTEVANALHEPEELTVRCLHRPAEEGPWSIARTRRHAAEELLDPASQVEVIPTRASSRGV